MLCAVCVDVHVFRSGRGGGGSMYACVSRASGRSCEERMYMCTVPAKSLTVGRCILMHVD